MFVSVHCVLVICVMSQVKRGMVHSEVGTPHRFISIMWFTYCYDLVVGVCLFYPLL